MFWLRGPGLTDEFVWRETFEGLEASAEVVGVDEVVEMLGELLMAVIMKALDGRFFDGPVHPLDLPVRPGMVDLGNRCFGRPSQPGGKVWRRPPKPRPRGPRVADHVSREALGLVTPDATRQRGGYAASACDRFALPPLCCSSLPRRSSVDSRIPSRTQTQAADDQPRTTPAPENYFELRPAELVPKSTGSCGKYKIIMDGLASVNKALEIKPDYIEAMTYKGLLLRTQALIEKDPKKQQELIKQGTELSDKANAMRKARQGN